MDIIFFFFCHDAFVFYTNKEYAYILSMCLNDYYMDEFVINWIDEARTVLIVFAVITQQPCQLSGLIDFFFLPTNNFSMAIYFHFRQNSDYSLSRLVNIPIAMEEKTEKI